MMELKFLFWKVENFGRKLDPRSPDPQGFSDRIDVVAQHIKELRPDIFCLAGIEDRAVLRSLLLDKFSDHDFGVSDDDRGIDLMVAWRRAAFDQVVFTQRREFECKLPGLKPGALIGARRADRCFNFLFVRGAPGGKICHYNARQETLAKIWSLKNTLDEIEGGETNFLALGDFNTMGRRRSGIYRALSSREEIAQLAEEARDHGMRLLSKTHEHTWRRGPRDPEAGLDLDHAIASANLHFLGLDAPGGERCAEMRVDGWQQLRNSKRERFTTHVSDHCSIFGAVV